MVTELEKTSNAAGRAAGQALPRAVRCPAAVAGLLIALVSAPPLAGLPPPATHRRAAEALLSGQPLGVPQTTLLPITPAQILALSPEMRAFLATHVDPRGSGKLKLHNLVAALFASGTFGLDYDDTTRSAAETFQLRRGNCLSFAGMFLAMARAVGLDARFQEVEVPPDWTLANDTFVLNRHVDVVVDLGLEGTRVVDFNTADFRSSYPMRRISDARAMAHFGNNLGVERLQAGDMAGAWAYFRAALLENDWTFAPAWTNLGTVYQRIGDLKRAELAYLQALEVARGDPVAMSNLASLYERTGDHQRAAALRAKVAAHRLRNPYYRYHLARQALAAGKLDEAIAHLKFATRIRPSEDRFCFLLGVAYQRRGNEREARRWFAQAQRVAAAYPALEVPYPGTLEPVREHPQQQDEGDEPPPSSP
ncbi:MAG: tetratricopeptide repeat protein [Thermoanaerobaculaceae bacterium]|nr:tetratricopeptide repeat protein [Thermoanaerobaculaceae bacterium]